MDEQESDNDKKPWFGPKRFGYGSRPTLWQGRRIVGLFVLTELVITSLATRLYPSWFTPKSSGSGFVPATWQGWLVVAGPGLLLLALASSIIHGQRQK